MEEYCEAGALVAEWPERAPHVFAPDSLRVRFEVTGERTRRLILEAGGERARYLVV